MKAGGFFFDQLIPASRKNRENSGTHARAFGQQGGETGDVHNGFRAEGG